MSKDIVIQASKSETRIAIVEDGSLAELYIENPENARTIGDIYLGRVRNVMPSIQAAFVNVGQKQDAFLHFSDVGETLIDLLKLVGEEAAASDIDVHVPRVHRSLRSNSDYDSSPSRQKGGRQKGGKQKGGKQKGGKKRAEFVHPARYLRNGEKVLVQIVKEPIASKGSRITTHVTLAGRFLVLVPFGDYVAVSKKIWSARERKRLQTLGRSILPDGFGLIIRTVAAGKDAKTLHTDLSLLIEKWDRIKEKLKSNPSPPKLLHQDVSMVSSVIRDLFTNDFDRILIDDHRLYRSIQTYIRAVAPSMLKAVQHHDSDKPVFEVVGVDEAIAEAFSSRVDLPSGGYVIIEHTEAMHVIDVNSGRAGRGESQEENSLKVDLEAAEVIAHQLRLRDLGGIIVVDFIDLREDKNRNKVVNKLKQEFRKDRAVTKVLPMSDFGVIQITRQRLRPSITTDEAAREAELASGDEQKEVKPTEKPAQLPSVDTVMEDLDRDLAVLRNSGEKGPVKLKVHPFQAAFLKKGLPNRLNRLRLKHKFKIVLEETEKQRPTTYQLIGKNGKEIPSRGAPAKSEKTESADKGKGSTQQSDQEGGSDSSGSSNHSDRSDSDDRRSDRGKSRSGRPRSNRGQGQSKKQGGDRQRGNRQRGNRKRGNRQRGNRQRGNRQQGEAGKSSGSGRSEKGRSHGGQQQNESKAEKTTS